MYSSSSIRRDSRPAAWFAIDQYALRGGRIADVVDSRISEGDTAGADPSNPLAAMTANKSS